MSFVVKGYQFVECGCNIARKCDIHLFYINFTRDWQNSYLSSHIYGVIKQNPIEIEQPVQKIFAIKEFKKQKETKGNTSFVWLHLKINISDFRLILLDHITNTPQCNT